ncbi:MAG: hypothetical protein AAGH65_00225 [Pseudomonadota bacterium]
MIQLNQIRPHATQLLLILMISATSLSWASPLTRPGEDAAQLIGQPGNPSEELYRVQFIGIDDRNITGNRDVLWIKPGRYTITVRMIVDRPPGSNAQRRSRAADNDTEYNKIEIVAEAGKIYHILGQYDDEREGASYRTILYRVSDSED